MCFYSNESELPRRLKMSVLVYIIVLSTFSGFLELAFAEKWVKSNPQGSFAMGYPDGYINNGDYEVVIPKGSDEAKRDVLIRSKNVRDTVDMIFNPNTMVFSNWDGWFKLGDKVYSDAPGVLYFMRSDHRCDKKMYDKQGDEIIAIDRDIIDESTCQALKAKVDQKMNHFLKYPFKYMLPKPDLEMKTKKGFPGGEYYTGKVSGNVYVCQHTVEIPSGDTDKDKEIVISAPGILDKVTMKVNANTQIYGKWDGSFYIGDKVYSNEPRVLYVDDDKGGCVKKVFEDHGTSVAIAFTKILQANDCFLIKNEVYNNMQKLIADPKLLAADEKPKPPPQTPPPITVTSTISGSPLQSTHTVTVGPGPPGSNTPENNGNQGTPGAQGKGQPSVLGNDQTPTAQQPLTSSASGITSNVHISTVSTDHPDYPSVVTTSVLQNPQQQPLIASVNQPQTLPVNQPQVLSVNQPQAFTVNQGQLVKVPQSNNAVTNQQLVISPTGEVRLVVPPVPSPPSTVILQPGNSPAITLQSNLAPQTDQYNALNVHSNNVNIQPDGSFLVGGKSLILQGLDPNADLVTPDGNVIRVGRSVNQGGQQQEGSSAYQTVTFSNQGISPPVITLTGNSQTPSGNVQSILTVPSNQESSGIQHTTTFNVPSYSAQQGSSIMQTQSPVALSTNFVVKNGNTQQPATKLFFLQSKQNSENSDPKPPSSSPLVLKLIQPGSSNPTIFKLQNNIQSSSQNMQNLNAQSQNEIVSSQQPNVMLTTSSQGHTISMSQQDKPVVLTVQNPNGPQDSQGNSNVHLSVGSSGSSILINSQASKQQDGSSNQPTKGITGENAEKEKSVFNLMRDLNLPSPVNNLIVNIAENTNFHKKKK